MSAVLRWRVRASGTAARLLVGGLVVLGAVLALPSLIPSTTPGEGGPAIVGTDDFSFRTAGIKSPTGRKPEASKLWFNDGSWWAVLFRPGRDAYVINRLDSRDDAWVDTGAVVDDRNNSRADMLWTGTKLYAVSGGTDPASDKGAAILVRMSYDPQGGTYAMDKGFPVQISPTGAETFTLTQDETGRLWVTWTAGRTVWIAHTLTDDRHWTEPSQLPVPEAQNLTADDISSIVAYDGHVGVMWSDQRDGAMYWASTPTGTARDAPWSVTAAVQGPGLVDDHMSLKALHDDPAGLVVAAVKTSRNDAPNADPGDPLILVLVLGVDGTWARHVASTVRENETRPLLGIDLEHRTLYVISSAPCCSGGTIYYKATSLDRIDFPPGRGSVLMKRTTNALNNPSAAKHDVTGETGLVVLASDDNADVYMHNTIALAGPPVPKPAPSAVATAPGVEPGTSAGAGASILFQDGFEDGTLAAWSNPSKGPQSQIGVEAGAARTDRLGLRLASGASPDGFAYARVALPEVVRQISVDLDVRLLDEGPAEANAPLVRLLAPDRSRILSVYRQNHAGGRIWTSTPDTREATLGRVGLDTWAHLEVRTRARGADVVADVRLDGQLIGQAILRNLDSGIGFIQVGNETKGQVFDISVDNVRVQR